jgi:hypothetical protein
MCKHLYPKLQKKCTVKTGSYYGHPTKDYYFGFYITEMGNLQCSYPIDKRDDSYHHHLIEPIHWFEFCISQLPELLFTNFKSKWEESEEPFEDFSMDGSSFGSDDITVQMCYRLREINPIDYLYENVYQKYVI